MTLGFLVPFVTSSACAQRIQFRDITTPAGIRFVHNNGAFGKKYLPETMGSGCAFIDYDNDGWPDILLVNSEDWPGHARAEPQAGFAKPLLTSHHAFRDAGIGECLRCDRRKESRLSRAISA